MSKSRGRGKTFNLSPFFRIFMPKVSLTFIASKGTNAPMTLPVTLPAAVKTHPIPPNSTQFCVKGICMIKQLFTVICGSASSDSRSRGTWYHGGSGLAFGYAGQVDPPLLHQASPSGLRLAPPAPTLIFSTNNVAN
jgi:hypothetical protein